MIKVSWSQLKQAISANNLPYQWVQDDNSYTISIFNGAYSLSCIIPIVPGTSSDQTDFETNYKSLGNTQLPLQTQPFTSKVLPNGKSLYKRFTGISQALNSGSNAFTWTQGSFPWVKFLGIEVIGAELGDTCSLFVLDTSTGTYSGYPNAPLNQFAFSSNVAPVFYKHESSYDADIYQGLQIKFVYTSVSAKTIYINFDMNEVK